MLTLKPEMPPEFRTDAQPEPVPPSTVMALVMVSVPYPAGSSASISPPSAVFEIAPANVLQGAVRLQGLTSSPTPDTQVRVACANAPDEKPARSPAQTREPRILFIYLD